MPMFSCLARLKNRVACRRSAIHPSDGAGVHNGDGFAVTFLKWKPVRPGRRPGPPSAQVALRRERAGTSFDCRRPDRSPAIRCAALAYQQARVGDFKDSGTFPLLHRKEQADVSVFHNGMLKGFCASVSPHPQERAAALIGARTGSMDGGVGYSVGKTDARAGCGAHAPLSEPFRDFGERPAFWRVAVANGGPVEVFQPCCGSVCGRRGVGGGGSGDLRLHQ